MTKDEALKLALGALERGETELRWQAITAIKEALAKPEQEPVAWAMLMPVKGDFIDAITPDEHARVEGEYKHPLYTTPPQRTWVGLTDDEMQDLWDRYAHMEMMRAIEAKLKEKNT